MANLLRLTIVLAGAVAVQLAVAKLPPPSEEAKAKAAEDAAKTAWSNKVAAYQLCRAQDRAVSTYRSRPAIDAKDAGSAVDTPPCTDPGPFAAATPTATGAEKAGAHSAPAATAPVPAAAAASASKP